MLFIKLIFVINILAIFSIISNAAYTYNVSKAVGLSRRFDGIGGISGGGCTTRLLADYNDEQYSQIMDYLFLPGFGASLHILKVEIGGDVQSTDGTEPSHMHSADDENYERGYEWRVMVEAKKRNPNITLYGLSWRFPGWVSEGTKLPWTNSTVTYTMNWLLGAKKYYNLDIDYVGIWNERLWDKWYTLALKAAITAAGLKTKIVGHDSGWNTCNDLANDTEWAAAVDVIGAHYPCQSIGGSCASLNKTKWASEEMSVRYNTGAQCWARVLNQNYVRANLTATIAWNLIIAFYDRLPCGEVGILRANEPWSGHYQIGQVLWMAAHWGQFTRAGWFFLEHRKGVGLLDNGGSYVSLTDPIGQQLTIINESMDRNISSCTYCGPGNYNITTNQTATFQLDSSFAHITQLFIFFSDLTTYDVDQVFIYKGIITLDNGKFTLSLPVGVVYTVSTINGTKTTYQSPSSASFPLPYEDNFDQSRISSEGAYFSDQTGSFEIIDTLTSRGKVMRQMVTEVPISWCSDAPYPFSVIGNPNWTEPMSVSADVMIEKCGIAFIALRIAQTGCGASGSHGIVLSIDTTNNGVWRLTNTTAINYSFASGNISIQSGTWYSLTLVVLTNHSEAYIDGKLVGQSTMSATTNRRTSFASIGSSWDYVQFDNFRLKSV